MERASCTVQPLDVSPKKNSVALLPLYSSFDAVQHSVYYCVGMCSSDSLRLPNEVTIRSSSFEKSLYNTESGNFQRYARFLGPYCALMLETRGRDGARTARSFRDTACALHDPICGLMLLFTWTISKKYFVCCITFRYPLSILFS